MEWRQANILAARTALGFAMALSSLSTAQARVPAPRMPGGDVASFSLILKVQSVDPGDPSDPDPDPDPDPEGREHDRGRLDRPDRPHEERLTQHRTDRIVQDLLSMRRECGSYDDVYRIDCLRQGIEAVVANMPVSPEYDDARRILRRASRELSGIVATHEDREAPRLQVRPDANPRFKKRRSYRALKREALPRAMARANAVVEEAATQLLRSAENSSRRYAHYQQISVAVDSTKTLLRSG